MRLLAVVCLASVDVCEDILEYFHQHFTQAFVTQTASFTLLFKILSTWLLEFLMKGNLPHPIFPTQDVMFSIVLYFLRKANWPIQRTFFKNNSRKKLLTSSIFRGLVARTTDRIEL